MYPTIILFFSLLLTIDSIRIFVLEFTPEYFKLRFKHWLHYMLTCILWSWFFYLMY